MPEETTVTVETSSQSAPVVAPETTVAPPVVVAVPSVDPEVTAAAAAAAAERETRLVQLEAQATEAQAAATAAAAQAELALRATEELNRRLEPPAAETVTAVTVDTPAPTLETEPPASVPAPQPARGIFRRVFLG
jgi:hypothetical protein